jgi:hypothetical protein
MKTLRLICGVFFAFVAGNALACASCGCTLNSDWGSQGLSNQSGWSGDIRFDAVNQNKLRAGTSSISPLAASQLTNTQLNTPAEVEQYTRTNTLTATLDYSNGDTWGISIVAPYLSRSHSTLGSGSDGVIFDPQNGAYSSNSSGIGDIRIISRYFGFLDMRNLGVQAGLKLPTGQTNQLANDGVTPVDPGLQLGTGTTDLILGAYYFDNFSDNWGYFLQGQYQHALNQSTINGQSYKPGDGWNFTAGLRYEGFETFQPMLQVNHRIVNTDSGDAADTFATGGTLVYLTPGLIVPVSRQMSLYGNIQLPIYQNVNGIQLVPTAIFSVGARFSF